MCARGQPLRLPASDVSVCHRRRGAAGGALHHRHDRGATQDDGALRSEGQRAVGHGPHAQRVHGDAAGREAWSVRRPMVPGRRYQALRARTYEDVRTPLPLSQSLQHCTLHVGPEVPGLRPFGSSIGLATALSVLSLCLGRRSEHMAATGRVRFDLGKRIYRTTSPWKRLNYRLLKAVIL